MILWQNNAFWYSLAGLVSAVLAVVLTDVTLTRKHGKAVVLGAWMADLFCYFLFALVGCALTSPIWYDYFIVFGWMIFLPIPCLFLYEEMASTKLFTVISVIFLSNVASFLTGITTTSIISTIDPFGAEGYRFLIPFTLVKALIALAAGALYIIFAKNIIVQVFQILNNKMGRFLAIPFVSCFGFFFIVQIVQAVGLLPTKGFLFVAFYLIVCLIFAVTYWLIFSNALWTSRALKTEAELNIASNIQRDMLPNIFPAFPEREDFDIYATMNPAKEVGGDFYDFFMVDSTHLGVVIADVSGKGVPAALFMVIAKTVIRNQAQTGVSLSEVFTNANDQLCENNGEGLFVTAFMGILDLKDGTFRFVNAGHNPPLIRDHSGAYQWMKMKPGFVLAGMDGMSYQQGELKMEPGDSIFLYTDGVTEAMNPAKELFGETRLENVLNDQTARNLPVGKLLPYVKEQVDQFAKGAEQADDITMLAMEYRSYAKL